MQPAMHRELERAAIAAGEAVHAAKDGLARDAQDNARWKDELKRRCLGGIRSGLEAALDADVAVSFIETPYNTKSPGRGLGKNEMTCQLWRRGAATRTVTVLADIVDGSWNAACGLPWSASTMLALSDVPKTPETLTLADFSCAAIVPMVGAVATPREPAGFYYGAKGQPPRYRLADGSAEWPLHATAVEDVGHTRLFLDLFTAERYEELAVSITAVARLMHDWGDIGRFYGAGMELMALLARPGTTPGFGGYVAASQKADNLIPTKMLLEGAGVIVSDWWGGAIDTMKIMDRRYVAIAANPALHRHLLGHLSLTRLP